MVKLLFILVLIGVAERGQAVSLRKRVKLVCFQNNKASSLLRFKTNRAVTNACSDNATNCAKLITYCTTKGYSALLKQHCKLTCGYCVPPPEKCKDAFNTCAKWMREGFCTTTSLSRSMKTSMCAKTCKLCGKSVDSNCDKDTSKYTE